MPRAGIGCQRAVPVKIKSLRTKRGMSRQQLGEVLGIEATQVGKYERGWEPLPMTVARDIAILFETDVEKVTGKQMEPPEWRDCKHAITDSEEPYGGLCVIALGQRFDYPVSLRERERIFTILGDLQVGNDGDRCARLVFEATNNRWVALNLAHVRRLALLSDDEEETPYYAHPEVYRAVYQNRDRDREFGPLLTKELLQHYEVVSGAEAAEALEQMRCIWIDGTIEEDMYLYDGWVGSALYSIELFHDATEPHPFARLRSEGYYLDDMFNLDHIAILEAPLEKYRRLTAPGD